MLDTQFHTLGVVRVIPETNDAVSISFGVPSEIKDVFAYSQGQYLTLRFLIKGVEVRRAYSMSSSPLEADLTISVKRVKKGIVSNHIFDHIRVGSDVEVMPPQGRFFTKLDAAQRKTYYLFGAGSGITPLMSILKTTLEEEPQSTIHLLYGNRSAETIMFKNQLDELQNRYADQLFVTHILSQTAKTGGFLKNLFKKTDTTAPSWADKTGRIDENSVREFIEENPCHTKLAEYFACGPGSMTQTVEETLKKNGVAAQHIHKELFTAVDSGGVATKGDVVKNATLIAHLDGERIETIVGEKITFLRALIDLKKDPPYSCTSGACSTCMAKVLRGTVKMDSCHALDEDEIANGYILTCQAHATSAEVEITYEV